MSSAEEEFSPKYNSTSAVGAKFAPLLVTQGCQKRTLMRILHSLSFYSSMIS